MSAPLAGSNKCIPEVFRYSDFRAYLKDYADACKRERRSWSYNFWARHLGLRSSSTLLMLVNGQRNPGPSLVQALCRHFGFDASQEEYFRNLVALERAKDNPALTVLLMENLSGAHPSGHFKVLDQKSFRAISNWHYYAIRELVNLAAFREDPKWIARALKGRITAKEAESALDTLLDLELLVRDRDGSLRQSDGHVDTSNDLSDEGLKRFHEQALDRARECLRDVSPELREISGTTFAIKRESLPQAKKLIRKFRTDLCKLLEEGGSDAVYQLEMAFFPLTELEKENS